VPSDTPIRRPLSADRKPLAAALLLGFSVSGLFDGILLHQVLQWHHLLSGVRRPWLADLRAQVLADGLFHAAMWCLLVWGLWLTWRTRRSIAGSDARVLVSRALIGFALWHAMDAVIDHWILAIHHIRQDAAHPVAWDIGWLLLFGVVPALIAMTLRRGDGGGSHRRSEPQFTPASETAKSAAKRTLCGLSVAALSLAALAVLLAPAGNRALVVALPGVASYRLADEIGALDARVVWIDRSNSVWSVLLPDASRDSASRRSWIRSLASGVLA
jgi:uncharacterized membrane protein